MSLRDALKAAVGAGVARCTPYAMQHATFAPEHATGTATDAQQQPANPHEYKVCGATDSATGTQLGSCIAPATGGADATEKLHELQAAEDELHVARTRECNTQLPARPHRLTAAEADEAHAEPWDEAAIAKFAQRVVLLLRRGVDAADADDLAERMHLRDLQADDRRLCVECRHLAGHASSAWRCGNHASAGAGRDLPADLVLQPQRCPGFRGAVR